MADNTIDTLGIQIESSTTKAVQALDSLAKKLSGVNSALKSVNTGGMRNYTREIGRMSVAVQSLNRIKIKAPDFGDFGKQIEKIGDIDSEKLEKSASGIEKLTKSISDIGNVNTKDNGINNTINALKRLSTAKIGTINPLKISLISSSVKSLSNMPDVSSSVNRFVSSFARLAQAGGNTGKSASDFQKYNVSSQAFDRFDFDVWRCLWRWCKRRHPKKSHKWIAKKYFRRVGTRNWTFSVNMADSFELHLIYATDTKIVRWLKTKSEATPFDERFTEYFEDRDTKRMLREINGRKKLNALYKMQKGICPHCGEPITVERGFRIHTEVGADFKEKNVLLHADCHRELHYSKNVDELVLLTQGL